MLTEEYDYTDQEVYEMTCECPAYYSYNGGGKHCIARIYGILLCRIRQQTVHTGLARRM